MWSMSGHEEDSRGRFFNIRLDWRQEERTMDRGGRDNLVEKLK